MTSPEWEAANEDDSDRFPQTSHASAPESTESHELGSRVVPDPARVARYAEALRKTDNVTLEETNFGQLSATYDDAARAVVAVADGERAALVAEVERLRHVSKQNAVQASRADRRADRLEDRAEAAEAKLAKVEALADEWEAGGAASNPFPEGVVLDVRAEIIAPLRAVLADAPAEQRAEGGA